MKVLFATYFDHIERCRYNPGLIVENWVDGVVFVSNKEEAKLVTGVDVVELDKGIVIPSDIPLAQNMCLDYCFDVLMADWVVYCHGDQYITEKGVERILAKTVGKPSKYFVPVPQTHLYSHLWMHYYTITLSHKDDRVLYDPSGDGMKCNIGKNSVEGKGLAYDIGYIGLPQYWGKMNNHRHIWSDDPYKEEWLKLYSENIPEAVRMAYRAIKVSKGETLSPIHWGEWRILLGKMNLLGDHTFCVSIMDSMM